MAVTKILARTEKWEGVIAYATNPAKSTHNGKHLASVINCDNLDKAVNNFKSTKKRFGKDNGVKAFHIIQSFKPNEITPELAHQVAKELAEKVFGDYEVVIGTHIDHDHIHSHIVVNSVSFVDGHRYRNNFKDYFHDIRKTSDELCAKYKLSVIEPQGKGKHYAEWRDGKQGKPTIRSMIRADIDGVIPKAINFEMFVGLLRKMGYKVKISGSRKYITLLAPFAKKPIRLSSKLGEGYSVEEITQRISKSLYKPHEFIKPPSRRYFVAEKPKPIKRYKGIQAIYWRYVIMLRKASKGQAPPKINANLRKEVLKMHKYVNQHNFLDSRNLTSIEDLRDYQKKVKQSINAKIEIRHDLRKGGVRGPRKTEFCGEKEVQRNERLANAFCEQGEIWSLQRREQISKEIKQLRAEDKMCENIIADNEKIQEAMSNLRTQSEQENAERVATLRRESEVKHDV